MIILDISLLGVIVSIYLLPVVVYWMIHFLSVKFEPEMVIGFNKKKGIIISLLDLVFICLTFAYLVIKF